jgi:hypothetical protein
MTNIIKPDILNIILSKMLDKSINNATYQIKQLQGGTLGDVQLVTGLAQTIDNEKIQYKVVWKKQKKWERPGDPGCWRREFDLYQSNLQFAFDHSLRRPECYHLELSNDTIELWMEYVDGVSSGDLSIEMLEQAAFELGRFQGKIKQQHEDFKSIACLGDTGFLKREFSQWHRQSYTYDFLISKQSRLPEFLKEMLKNGQIQLVEGKSFEYSYLRSKGCDIPEKLKQMIVDIDDRKDELFERLNDLPVVLCHRDFWIENIFFIDGTICLIDWDTAGWGYLGEDIASLIVDGMDIDRFEENYNRLIPAYLKGIMEYMNIPNIDDISIFEMILIKFGYRMMQERMFSEAFDKNNWGINALLKVNEIMNSKK